MKSLVPKAYRSVTPSRVTPNDATAGWSAAAVVSGIAAADDKEEEDCVGDDYSKDSSDEEYIPDDIDDNCDENTWREVDEDQEKERGEQEDGNADEDGLDSSNKHVYLGRAGNNYPGSQSYRNTVECLAKSCGLSWNEVFFKRLLERHPHTAFRIGNSRNGRWRKASLSEIESAVRRTLKGFRRKDQLQAGDFGGRPGEKRKSYPKVASRPRPDDDYEDEVVDTVAASKSQSRKKTHAKKRPPLKTRGLGIKLNLDNRAETKEGEVDEREDANADEEVIHNSKTDVYLGLAGIHFLGSLDYRNTLQRLTKTYSFYWSDHIFDRLLEIHKANTFRIVDPYTGCWRRASLSEIKKSGMRTLRGFREKDQAEAGNGSGRNGKERKSFPKVASRPRRDDVDNDDEAKDDGAKWNYDDKESDQDRKPAAIERKAAKFQVQKKTHAKKRPPGKTLGLGSKLKLDKLTEKYVVELKKLKEEASKSNDPEEYGEGKEILNRIVQMEESLTKRGI
jgi:hypothetical protein